MPQKEKKDGKLNTWFQAKVKAVTDWYNRDDNFLRRIRFPGTRLPLLTVVINFIKLFTKGRTIDRAAGALGVTGCTSALGQYLDFQFVVSDFGDDALVGDGF